MGLNTVTVIAPDDLTLPAWGISARKGQPIEVPQALAGRLPDPRLEPAMQELRDAIAALDHATAQARRNEIAGLDMGEGLLAQGWTLAPIAKPESAKTTKEKP